MRNGMLMFGSFILSILIFCVVFWQWQHFENMTTQEKQEWTVVKGERKMPQIYAVSRRLKQGEKIAVSDLAHASDADGRDISDRLRCYDEEGTCLSGFYDTGKPGKWVLSWEVESVLTGRRARKRIIVLVDGRPEP